jgi:hypothetical protein
MRQLAFRVLIAAVTFTLGSVAAWWSVRYFSAADQLATDEQKHILKTGQTAPPEWKKINMEGKATFHIPPSLKPEVLDAYPIYRAFHSEGLEVSMFYYRIGTGGPCIAHAEEKLSKHKVSKTRVGGREATLLNIEKAVFGPQHLKEPEPLRGLTICVPSVGDGEHEFNILVRYKSEQDFQDTQRIIDSIKFR